MAIDSMIVGLGFDNKQFEVGAQSSIKTLEQLKKSLNFEESGKSLSGISVEAKKFNLNTMAEAVNSLKDRFSTLGIIGMTVLHNLTNTAITYGKKLMNSVMSPMKTGMQEYETQINAIQTVLANTQKEGTTLKEVSAALDELNRYADKTIYNFTEMTRNIGTFTAAGVSLDKSTAAIKGISNLAAISGSNSQQASTAMYQLSQALSSGTVKLMDWNSVVNAGMGGQVFQDALTETARVSGIAIDDLIAKHGSFRETLSEGWLSSEVLLHTLAKFTGDLSEEQLKTMGYTEDQIKGIVQLGITANDAATKVKTFTQLTQTLAEATQSGWTKSWELIIGNFEEAKELYTEISDTLGAMIQESSDARNAILMQWREFGGREAAIQTLRNAFQALLSIIEPIKKAFREIFPAGDFGKTLADMTKAIEKFTSKLILTEATADKVKRIFAGVFSIFAIGRDIVSNLIRAIINLTTGMSISGGGFLDMLAKVGDYIVAFRKGIDITKGFEWAILQIKNGFASFSKYLGITKESLLNFKNTAYDSFKNIFNTIKVYLTKAWESLLSFKDQLSSIFTNIDLSPIKNFFNKFTFSTKPATDVLTTIKNTISNITSGISSIIPGLSKVGEAIKTFILNIGDNLSKGIAGIDYNNVFTAINTGLIATLVLTLRNFMKSGSKVFEGLGDMFKGVTNVLDGVRGSLEAWQQNLKSKILINIAIAIGILAASLYLISRIDGAKLAASLGVVTMLFLEIIAAQTAFSKTAGGFNTGILGIIALSTALLIMAGAVKILSNLDIDNAHKALGIIVGLMATMVVFSKVVSNTSSGLIKTSATMILVSISLLFLVKVLEKIANIDTEKIGTGLLGLGVLLLEIGIFSRLLSTSGINMGFGISLLAISAALMVLVSVVEKFGNMDVSKLQQGLTAIGVILLELGIFSRLQGNGLSFVATSIGIVILTGALMVFAEVIKKMGEMDIDTLKQGLIGLAGALLIISIATRLMPSNILLQAVGLVVMAGALYLIADVLAKLGKIGWDELGKGLIALAGSLLIISLALYAMSGTIAGSFALLIASAALLMLSQVLLVLGNMEIQQIGIALLGLAGVFLVLGLAGLILTPLVPVLLALGVSMLLLGVGAALVGAGLLAFATGLMAIAAGGTVAALAIVGFVEILLTLIPKIIATIVEAIISFAQGIAKAAPQVQKAISAVLIGILQTIIDVAPKLFQALDVLLKGLVKLIVENVPNFIDAALTLLGKLLTSIAGKIPEFVQAGFDIVINFLKGVRDNIGEVVKVGADIIINFLKGIQEKAPELVQSGYDTIISFIDALAGGIEKNTSRLITAVARLGTAIIDGLKGAITKGASSVVEALTSVVSNAWEAVKKKLLIRSPSKAFLYIGKMIIEGLVKGIKTLSYKAKDAMENLGDNVSDEMKGIAKILNDLLNENLDLNPSITPIFQMDDIYDKINKPFVSELTLIPVLDNVNNIATGINNSEAASGGIVNNFTQNNYSPVELDAYEIYKNTKYLLITKGLG